ncbi:MAG TPA: SpoIID/LytB domain-containing protein [Clostridiales bacterium]|nr:SpoIID/LytB domain-containing protein [Clostridiales bacterium]
MCKRFYVLLSIIFVGGLIFVFSGSALAYDGYQNPIRVYLNETSTAPMAKVTYGTYQVLNSGGMVTKTLNAGSSVTLAAGEKLSSVNGYGRFSYGSYEYRGDLTYKGGYVVNTVGLEQYLYSVVMLEIGGYAPGDEALKVQAVASRNYACLKLKTPRNAIYYDILNSTSDQLYRGYTGESYGTAVAGRVRGAVEATAGLVMYYNGTLVNAIYMANGGGCTESAENVWGGSYPYLQGISCPWDALPFEGDAGSHKSMKMPTSYEWTVTMSFADLASKLGYGGTITDVTVSYEGCVSDYAKTVTVTGTRGSVTYKGTDFRSKLGLRSANLDIVVGKSVAAYKTLSLQYVTSSSFVATFATSGKMITVNGRGYGHSVGMSQWSACVMAYQGQDYRSILNYFYNQNQNNHNLKIEAYR